MRNFGICERTTKEPCIVLQEKRSKITFENKDKVSVRVVEVDNCVIKQGLRCDYLLISNRNTEHFIELKGSDVEHAVKQLEQTIKALSLNPTKGSKYSFIVSTRCPLLTTKIQSLKLKFKKRYNSVLIIKNMRYVHRLQ